MTTPADDLRTLAHEAYVYLYPLVTMDVTREMRVSRPAGSAPGAGPPNRFHHLRAFPAADFRAVVRPGDARHAETSTAAGMRVDVDRKKLA
ncbi:hypothetical protein M3765_16490 [Streptomyces thermoviolaceus]|uniref:hypothetical protein n=1 Tax=Streptomyces thermoviolaceus TaxID=1952 RepID=UPI00203AE7E6|nr:hypothetical protein [Streptomyces thermoviolaceus]MCM3265599.1 hypothetical protein [Streptomyces thermoviolaceus]